MITLTECNYVRICAPRRVPSQCDQKPRCNHVHLCKNSSWAVWSAPVRQYPKSAIKSVKYELKNQLVLAILQWRYLWNIWDFCKLSCDFRKRIVFWVGDCKVIRRLQEGWQPHVPEELFSLEQSLLQLLPSMSLEICSSEIFGLSLISPLPHLRWRWFWGRGQT